MDSELMVLVLVVVIAWLDSWITKKKESRIAAISFTLALTAGMFAAKIV